MPRTTRLTEVPQKQTPRGPSHLRTSSSASDPLHHRVKTERIPKIAEGRSPRGAQSDPVNKKKLGTRIADLESQLGQAQDELKSLKDQLVSAETAKKVAQEQLDKKAKKQQNVPESMQIQEKHSTSMKTEEMDMKNSSVAEFGSSDEVENETDVFEVPMETKTQVISRSDDLSSEMAVVTTMPENSTFDELGSKNDEINLLKTKLDEKDKEMGVFQNENQSLKNELNEKSLKMSSDQSQIEELILKLNTVDQELENTKNNALQINEKLIATEKAKEELESEMKRLRVQTEQWRKAADAAASVLAGGVEMNGRRVSERCGSMDNHYRSTYEPVGVYPGYVDSPRPMDDESDDAFEGGKRKGSGIRMFGDLWKRKGQK